MSSFELARVPLESREYEGLRRVIREVAGISIGDQKQELVAGRLQSRLRALKLKSFSDYLKYLAADVTGAESRELVNCITTNKTSFFREPHHFDFMRQKLLPELIERSRAGTKRKIRVWSAGCSTGQEPWTIAMTIADTLGSLIGWDIRILASDLDTNVLATAEAAIYDELAVSEIPPHLREKYLEPVRENPGFFQVASSLRAMVTFRRINLTAPSTWSIRTQFDVVFCRNVAIYFDRPTQETVFKGLTALLEPTGYLISGHSENLHWLSSVIEPVGKTIHKKAGAIEPAPESGVRPSVRPRPAIPPRAAAVPPPLPPTALLERPPPVTPRVARAEVAIQVGGIHASKSPVTIRTTLGSCVAVCLWDPETRIGGMNHFLLPEDRDGGSRSPSSFGVNSMELLINAMMKLGADRRRFVAKVFGGGAVLGAGFKNTVGARNAEFALGFLSDEGITVAGQKLGASSALSVLFDTETGVVRVKEVSGGQEVMRVERAVLERLSMAPPRPIEDDITFFGAP